MTDRPEMSRLDREMVRRALEARRAPDPEPPGEDGLDDTALAAYLDGTLDAHERDRIEAALAADPEAVELWLAARDSLEAAAGDVPEAAIRRAQALIAAPRAGAPARRPTWISAWLTGLAEAASAPIGAMPRPLGAALAVLALILVSATGFELGRTGYGNLLGGAQPAQWDDDTFADPTEDIL